MPGLGTTFALSLAATLVIVHRAVSLHPKAELSDRFLTRWGVSFGASLLLLAVVAGLLVFRRATPWEVVLTWPWIAGLAVGLGYFIGLTGQMDGGSKLCDVAKNSSCDTSRGLGALLVTLAAGLALGGVFIARHVPQSH